MASKKELPLPGPYIPTLILHGGAGNITRENLPPALYDQYESSLLQYLAATRQWLNSGASALDAAVHAVSLMEDDPLFNCGRGAVFTEEGSIEMEASVMVASVNPDRSGRDEGSMAAEHKRGASVSLVRNTRHPIQLARAVLLVKPDSRASSMHCQLSGPEVEEWGWKEKGLERKDDSWFWTEKRWNEHLRGLERDRMQEGSVAEYILGQHSSDSSLLNEEDDFLPSQGTVGAVCMDSWGDIAVATSTGGLTNKKAGRIGDTPTLGAGFWAEDWEESTTNRNTGADGRNVINSSEAKTSSVRDRLARAWDAGFGDLLSECLPSIPDRDEQDELLLCSKMGASSQDSTSPGDNVGKQPRSPAPPNMSLQRNAIASKPNQPSRRRAIAVSGTGNGDTFLRTAACHTTAAICRYSTQPPTSQPVSLATALRLTAGPGGELQKSAGGRWKVTGEGQAGMIGIEVCSEILACDAQESKAEACGMKKSGRTGRVVFDFNCGGLWRAWVEEETGRGKVMVFRENYYLPRA